MVKNREADEEMKRQTNRQTDRQTDRETDRHTGRQADKQSGTYMGHVADQSLCSAAIIWFQNPPSARMDLESRRDTVPQHLPSSHFLSHLLIHPTQLSSITPP